MEHLVLKRCLPNIAGCNVGDLLTFTVSTLGEYRWVHMTVQEMPEMPSGKMIGMAIVIF